MLITNFFRNMNHRYDEHLLIFQIQTLVKNWCRAISILLCHHLNLYCQACYEFSYFYCMKTTKKLLTIKHFSVLYLVQK